VPFAVAYFGGAGTEYARRHGTRPETFAAIAVKARRHAANNPDAVFRAPVTVDEVLASPAMYGPLTRLQCCPSTSGAAEDLAKEWGWYAVNVNAAAYGVVATRLTDPAGPGSIDIAGRQLAVVINPDIAASLDRAIPLRWLGTVQGPPAPPTCGARRRRLHHRRNPGLRGRLHVLTTPVTRPGASG
jgi:hypothetical protein